LPLWARRCRWTAPPLSGRLPLLLEPAEEAAVFGAPSCWQCGPAVAIVVGPLCAGAGGPGVVAVRRRARLLRSPLPVVAATVAAVANVRRSPTGGVCCRFQDQRLLVLELLPACPTARRPPWELVAVAGAVCRRADARRYYLALFVPLCASPARLPRRPGRRRCPASAAASSDGLANNQTPA